MEDTDIVVGSRTQTLEQVQQVLDDEGFEPVSIETATDDPAAELAGIEHPDGSAADGATGSEGDEGAAAVDGVEAETAIAGKPRKKRPGGLERKLHKRDTEIAELRQKLTALEGKVSQGAEPSDDGDSAEAAGGEAGEQKPRPKLDDFVAQLGEDETYESAVAQFTDALLDWRDEEKQRTAKQKRVTNREAEQKAEAKADETAQAGQWNAQVEMAMAAHDDWAEKIGQEFEEPVSNPVMNAAVQNLEEGAELVYWLACHPEEAARIQKLTNLKGNPTQTQINRAFAVAYRELAKLDLPAMDPNSPTSVAASGSAASRGAQGTDAARESRVAAITKAKAIPPAMVGSRGGGARKTKFEDYSVEELKNMPAEDYRRLRGM